MGVAFQGLTQRTTVTANGAQISVAGYLKTMESASWIYELINFDQNLVTKDDCTMCKDGSPLCKMA